MSAYGGTGNYIIARAVGGCKLKKPGHCRRAVLRSQERQLVLPAGVRVRLTVRFLTPMSRRPLGQLCWPSIPPIFMLGGEVAS